MQPYQRGFSFEDDTATGIAALVLILAVVLLAVIIVVIVCTAIELVRVYSERASTQTEAGRRLLLAVGCSSRCDIVGG